MRYEKTVRLVDTLISENLGKLEIRKPRHGTQEMLYRSEVSDLHILVRAGNGLYIGIFTPERPIARLRYKESGGGLVFDPGRSRGHSGLARVNRAILAPEIERLRRERGALE